MFSSLFADNVACFIYVVYVSVLYIYLQIPRFLISHQRIYKPSSICGMFTTLTVNLLRMEYMALKLPMLYTIALAMAGKDEYNTNDSGYSNSKEMLLVLCMSILF